MGKKNNKSGAQPMSPEKYIKEKARMLPLGKCYTYANWKDADEIMVIVTRIHPKGTVTCADFCIDKLCRGLIRTRYFFNVSPRKLAEIVEYYSDKENDRMVEISYEVAHNLIYGSIEFAEEAGIEPVDAWDITQYILEEDDDNVPLIEYQWGLNGMHYLLAEDRLEVSCYLSTMQEHLGRNFKFRVGDSTAYIGGWDWHEEEFQGCEYEIHEEVYGYELPSYPTHIKLLHPEVMSYLTFHAYEWILPDHIIDLLLTIDHEELRQDLENIIRYGLGKYQHLKATGELFAAIRHSIILLAEVGNMESFRLLMDVLKFESDFLDQLSWLATNYLFAPTLYKLNPDPFSEFTKFLKTPKLDHYCRMNVYEYVEFYVEKNPALKEQATAWVKDMLVFYDGRLETADCCDGYVVAAAIDLACSLGAKDLIPIINKLLCTYLVDFSDCGLTAEVVEGLHRGELLRQEYALDVYERYHRLEEDSNR